MYILLVILIIAISVVAYIKFEKDIFSPTIITCVMYVLSAICAIIGKLYWNDQPLSVELITYMILGIASFGVGEYLGRKIAKKKHINKSNTEIKEEEKNIIKKIEINDWKKLAIVLFIAVTIILMFIEVKRIASDLGYNGYNISKMISTYRKSSSLFNENAAEKGYTINVLVSQMKKVCDVICVISIYVLINNFLCRDTLKKYFKENYEIIMSVFLCFIMSIFTSGRAQLMKYIISTVIIYGIMLVKITNRREALKKILKVGVSFALIAIIAFYAMLPLIGRSTNKEPIEYLSFYFGCPIPSFQRYLNNPPKGDGHFGSETLYGVQNILYKLKISDYSNKISREWRRFKDADNNIFKSNVFTGYRRYYNDYGFIGIIVCSFIFGLCFYALYDLAKNKKNKNYLLFYALYSYMLIDQVRDELFFTRFININTIINLVLVIVLSWGIFEFKFSDINLYMNNVKSLFCKFKKIKTSKRRG